MKQFAAMLRWSLRRSAIGLISLLTGIALFEFIQPVALRSLGDLDRLSPFLSIVPPSFWALLNVTPDFLSSAGTAGYLSIGFTHPVFIILAATAAVWFAARGLAGEMERGTIHFSLARPVSRLRLYLGRSVALLIVVTAIAAIGPLGMAAGLLLSPPQGTVAPGKLALTGVAAWLLVWAIGGAAMLGSAAADSMSQAIGWAIGALVVSYVVDYFSALWHLLQPIEPFSIFHYYDPAVALAQGTLPLQNVVVLGAVGLIGAAAGFLVFVRRDLPI